MATLTDQGYLRSLIDSLLHDHAGLKETLEPNPKSLRVLYVYESKMALLIKIASTRLGAETVLAQGALSCLANMTVLSCHPDIHTGYGQHKDTEFVPSVANRFRQILVPALALCDALLTTLGTDNHSCVIHVTHLLLSHVECIDCVLRAAHPNSPQGLLTELEWITSVIARASNQEVFGLVQTDTALQHSAASLQRVQSLMLALLPRFQQPPPAAPDHDDRLYYKTDTALQHSAASLQRVQSLMLALLPRFQQPPPAAPDHDDRLYYKIVCNLLTYARNILARDGSRVLFRPSLAVGGEGKAGPHCGAVTHLLQHMCARAHSAGKLLATQRHQLANTRAITTAGECTTCEYTNTLQHVNTQTHYNMRIHDGSRVLFRPSLAVGGEGEAGPHCGAVTHLLQHMCARAHSAGKLLATQRHQLANTRAITTADMKKLLPPDSANLSPVEMRARVVSLLRTRLRARKLELSYCSHACEAALYLVWAHARVYLRQAVPTDLHDTTALSVAKAWSSAAGNDLPELRKGLVAVFNDRFTDQLLETSKNQPAAQRGFLEVLLKDIKTMIQFSPL
ncbi:hypothetical protein O0L34_g12803 [Tuta absoluta]|nr:hypothetical protein O0L34_g12803 [Tuta absoluta]